MAGLVPAIHVLNASNQRRGCPAWASQRVRPEVAGPMTGSAMPLFERLWPGMTELRFPGAAQRVSGALQTRDRHKFCRVSAVKRGPRRMIRWIARGHGASRLSPPYACCCGQERLDRLVRCTILSARARRNAGASAASHSCRGCTTDLCQTRLSNVMRQELAVLNG
jgi:hypothetical protein